MPLNTVYQVRFKQTWGSGGKPLENVFFFERTAGTGVASDLATDFGTAIAPAINAIQNNVVKNISINVINLGDLGDFAEPAFVGTGVGTGETLPPFNAVGFTFKVNTRAVRHGGKRIAGVPESAQNNGIITDATYIANIETLRLAMQDELVSADNTWLPVVVKRVKTAVTGTVPLQYTYRLPTTDLELVLGEVTAVLTTTNLTHQVSREV